ncbi:MAG: cyclic nucleotide-binding domain-containing protein [Bosea sp. (in: a-proteobacteria)]
MALQDDIALFERHRLLGAMEHEALRLIAFAADKRTCRVGDVLARKGEPAECAFLIESGELTLDEGNPSAESHVAREGALIGEKALVCEMERRATITARAPTVVRILRRETMRRVLAEFPGSAAAVHRALAADLVEMSGKLRGVRTRLDAIED